MGAGGRVRARADLVDLDLEAVREHAPEAVEVDEARHVVAVLPGTRGVDVVTDDEEGAAGSHGVDETPQGELSWQSFRLTGQDALAVRACTSTP